MGRLTDRCRFTLIGKFSRTRPRMEVIRQSFIAQTQLVGGVKIPHFNCRNIYIDLDNDADHITIWTKERMYIHGQMMRLQLWTPTFKPERKISIVPVWVTLPELPWHCYYMEVISAILAPIDKALQLNSANIQKTKGSVTKVKVQLDIIKDRPQYIWLGFDENDITVSK